MNTEYPEDLPPLSKPKVKKKKSNGGEETEQLRFVQYLKATYPDVLYRVAVDGVRLSIGTAVKLKKSGVLQRSLPDVEVFYPTSSHHGLFIEMKVTGRRLRKRDGSYVDEHTAEQANTLRALNSVGYYATFCCGYEHAVRVLNAYVSQNVVGLAELLTV